MVDGTIYDFFDVKLQNLIRRKYNVYLPIERNENPAKESCILHKEYGVIGDEYTGKNYSGRIELKFFKNRDGQPLDVRLDYNWHDLSGQMDDWALTASGINEEDLNDFKKVFDLNNYNFYMNNNIRLSYSINGAASDANSM